MKVDAPAHSIPATYMGRDGKQYVVVSAAGGGFLRDPTADAVIAFALPAKGKQGFGFPGGIAYRNGFGLSAAKYLLGRNTSS